MAITRLPNMGMLCEYNGVTWGPSAETTAFSVKPNLDPAGRTVMSATYTMTIAETIADATTTDPVILDKIARLSRNAGRLRYKGRGFGDIELNRGGLVAGLGKRDVKWGPITQNVTCEAVGAGKAVRLTWTVEFTTVNCPDGLTHAGQILQFTYTVGYEIDRAGYTVRTYDASLTIAQTKKRVDSNILEKAADEHLEKMMPALPVQFRPESVSRRLSLDKCTLHLTVKHVQMPQAAPPDGCVDGSVEHSYSSDGLYKWRGQISATYDLARVEGDPAKAIEAFFALVRDRVAEARKMICDVPARPGEPPPLRVPVVLVPTHFGASEPNVYGRKQVRLSLNYHVSACTFGELLRSGGLWRPFSEMAGAKGWKEWVASIPTALSPRGHALLRFDPKEDALVDACVPGSTPAPPKDKSQVIVGAKRPAGTLLTEAFPPPSREASWLAYRSAIRVHVDTGVVLGKTLPTAPLSRALDSPTFNALAGMSTADGKAAGVFGSISGQIAAPSQTSGAAFTHQRTRPIVYVTLSGQALRAGYQIPLPELVEVNGVRPVLIGQPWYQAGVVAETTVPIVRAEWSLTYAFTEEGGVPSKAISAPPAYGFG